MKVEGELDRQGIGLSKNEGEKLLSSSKRAKPFGD